MKCRSLVKGSLAQNITDAINKRLLRSTHYEVPYGPMEYGAIVVAFRTESDEIFAGFVDDVAEQLEIYVAVRCLQLDVALLLDHRVADNIVGENRWNVSNVSVNLAVFSVHLFVSNNTV